MSTQTMTDKPTETMYEFISTNYSDRIDVDALKEAYHEYYNKRNAHTLTFGKYKGWTVSELIRTERGEAYLRWLQDKNTRNPYLKVEIDRAIDECDGVSSADDAEIREMDAILL